MGSNTAFVTDFASNELTSSTLEIIRKPLTF